MDAEDERILPPLLKAHGPDEEAVNVWDLATGETDAIVRGQMGSGRRGQVNAMRLAPDGRTLVVGTILFAINQLDVVLAGAATPSVWIKAALTFAVPFCVSNYGILVATHRRKKE